MARAAALAALLVAVGCVVTLIPPADARARVRRPEATMMTNPTAPRQEAGSGTPEENVEMYCNRALAHTKQGSWLKAQEDARRGLALCDFCFESDSEVLLDLKSRLTDIVRQAELREVLEEARSSTIVAPSIIEPTSPLGIALQDVETTAYFHEAQFRELPPGSKQRFLATTNVLNCIVVLACSSDGRAFGAHINVISLFSSLYEINVRGIMPLENMSRAMQRVFSGVDQSQVTISLVGGWRNTDCVKELKETYYPEEEAMWHFSAVVRRFVVEALPGASIDTSLLNRFDGIEREDLTPKNRLRCIREGQGFRVVALDSHTGKVETQTTDVADCGGGFVSPGLTVPLYVRLAAGRHVKEMWGRYKKQKSERRELSPIMTEYKD